MNNRAFYLNHSPIEAYFMPTPKDFVVTEIPLYEFSGEGEHLIIQFRKKNLTTWEALEILSNTLGCKVRDIGYAGLKDKNAMTIQYISLHKKFEARLNDFNHPSIKILSTTYHNNKIRTGHLKGNKFFIRLKRINKTNNRKIGSVLQQIANQGIPNYFGHQRFGIDGKNHLKAIEILNGNLKIRNKKEKEFILNAYQSHLFNDWLSLRVQNSRLINEFEPKEISSMIGIEAKELKSIKAQPHFFKIFDGELMHHYPYGKLFELEDIDNEATRFHERDIVPTGLLGGKKVKRASGLAQSFEEKFDISTIHGEKVNSLLNGTRRYAWIYPDNIDSVYKDKDNHLELNFALPKGSYATVFIEQLLNNIGISN
jgi:tRNA pseudouridine13 synthase